jgi:hypothetical protein
MFFKGSNLSGDAEGNMHWLCSNTFICVGHMYS